MWLRGGGCLRLKSLPSNMEWKAHFDMTLLPIPPLQIQPKLLSIACTVHLLQTPANLSKDINCLQHFRVKLSSLSLTVISLAGIIGCCRPAARTWEYSNQMKTSEHHSKLQIVEGYSELWLEEQLGSGVCIAFSGEKIIL